MSLSLLDSLILILCLSLIGPFFVMIITFIPFLHKKFSLCIFCEYILLLLWPSSIVLISLGGSNTSSKRIIYIWSIAIATNIVMFTIIYLGISYWYSE